MRRDELKDHVLNTLLVTDKSHRSKKNVSLSQIVLVGHGVLHDIKGIVIEELPVIVGIINTARMT